jgi:hypothetical protein
MPHIISTEKGTMKCINGSGIYFLHHRIFISQVIKLLR